MRMGYIDTTEGQIHYRTDGTGEPILLLHQTPFYTETRALVPFLANNFQVVVVDTVGYGSSSIPPREYEMEDFGRGVISLLDGLGIKKTNIFGHHTGAVIGVEVATTYPERVDKLILSGCPYWPKQKWEKYFESTRERRSQPWPTDDGKFLLNSWEAYKKMSPNTGPETWIQALICSITSKANNPYDAHFAVGRYDIISKMLLIKSPTLLISGSNDMFLNLLETTKNAVPRCRTQVIQDGGILICLEKPKELAQAITNFVKNPEV